MRRARAHFKYSLRLCRNLEDTLKADALAKSILNKHPNEFGKGVKKSQGKSTILASTINGVTGETDIANLWKDHFESLYNSTDSDNHCNEDFVKKHLKSS